MSTILTSRLGAEIYDQPTGPELCELAHPEDHDLTKHFMDSDLDDVLEATARNSNTPAATRDLLAEDLSSFVHTCAPEAAGAEDPPVTVRVVMD